MKLLVLTQKVDRSDGTFGFFHQWIEKISENVKELHVIGVAGVGEYDLPANVKVYSVGHERDLPKLAQRFLLFKNLLKILPKVDGIFVHMCPEYIAALHPLNIFFRKPIVMWYAHIQVSKLATWAIKKVKAVLSPSKESFDYPTDKVISTGHGINTDLFKPIKEFQKQRQEKHILSFSRISIVKEIEVLVEAARILAHEHNVKNFHVDIYGEPARPEDFDYKRKLEEKIKKDRTEEHIFWKGPARNTDGPKIYNETDVFARMQAGGGFGKTELEAMACGIPTVMCTDVHNEKLGEFAKDLYWEEKKPEELAKRIMAVMKWTPEQKNRYTQVARDIVVEGHNLSKLAKKIVGAFE